MIPDRKDYHELSDKLRGQIIGATINLELVIEQFIALYFCSNDIKKTKEFIKLIFKENTGFGRKIELLEYILSNEDKELLIVHPNVLRNIKTIVEYRNNLAHRYLDTTRNSIDRAKPNNSIILMNLKTSKETSYTSDEIKEILELTYYCTNILMYWHHSETVFPL